MFVILGKLILFCCYRNDQTTSLMASICLKFNVNAFFYRISEITQLLHILARQDNTNKSSSRINLNTLSLLIPKITNQ